MPKINISIQNLCSLNISKPCRKTYSKLASVVKSESDIILLCDTRLNSDVQIAALNDINVKLRFMGYSLFHNSTRNSRGTAILVSKKLLVTVEDSYRDLECNILLLKLRIGAISLTLGSIYGPNTDDEQFFNRISEKVRDFASDFAIIGGDWNTTYDMNSTRLNRDVLNTVNIPSVRRSRWLNQLRIEHHLTDPYRYLYPESQEYTYVPFAADAIHRSRLDFFIMSESLVEQCVDCRIPHSLNSLLSDHKQVTLCFKRDNPYKKQTINDVVLTDSDLDDIVKITTLECYINHLIPSNVLSDFEIDNQRVIIGRVRSLYKELSTVRLQDAELGSTQDRIDVMLETRNAIKNNLDLLPSIEELQSCELSCSRDTFLEILIMAIKGSSLSHQHNFFKIKNARRKAIENKIKELKKFFSQNMQEILRVERELNQIAKDDMREEVMRIKNFEQLNNEKITPYFLSLAKKPQCSDTLLDICQENGTPFENSLDRDTYIRNYFASTYKQVPNNGNIVSIEGFLGDVAEHPEVVASKLSWDEREELEKEIGIAEFDVAIEKAKINTSPGIDSISNRFIKKFWNIFRVPLFEYAKCCYAKGILTENFRCAKIRLIPKKGDTSLLKNWRPISLLNCFYKLISRVIALRLKTIMDKITRVGQKGFSSTKYCQEVLIDVIDSISAINKQTKNGVLLSLDIKKAFDSTSHSYLQMAYQFFNFGPNFIKWLNLIGTNRKACIILGNGMYSEFFDLERGNAQGDTRSPYIFNIGFQILLLKLTFDLQIDGVIEFPTVPGDIPPLPPTVGTYPRKVRAFADDASVIVKYTYENLLYIKTILEEFGNLSGLVCNVEKTVILPIGNNENVDGRIVTLGFQLADKLTILGLEISNRGFTEQKFRQHSK
jgi:exonuclease III